MFISIICTDNSRVAFNKDHIVVVDLQDKQVTIRTLQSSTAHVSNYITCPTNKIALEVYNFIVSSNTLNSTFDLRKVS